MQTAQSRVAAWTFRANPASRLRAFCLPYAGAGASVYARWQRRLPADVELVSVELPGRESSLSSAVITDMDVALAELVRVVESRNDKPFVLFGHSLGALLSFELTRDLVARGSRLPSMLLVSGKRAPAMPSRTPPIYGLGDDEFIEEIRKFNGTPEDVLAHRELLALMLPALRADSTLFDRYVYRHRPPLPCPIVAFGGDRDPYVTLEELHGWAQETSAAFDAKVFAGDHFFIHDSETELLRDLGARLERVVAGLVPRRDVGAQVDRGSHFGGESLEPI